MTILIPFNHAIGLHTQQTSRLVVINQYCVCMNIVSCTLLCTFTLFAFSLLQSSNSSGNALVFLGNATFSTGHYAITVPISIPHVSPLIVSTSLLFEENFDVMPVIP